MGITDGSEAVEEWVAYCVVCGKEIYRAPNGGFVEAAAKRHVKETEHAPVIVGYEVNKTWSLVKEPTEKEAKAFEERKAGFPLP